MGQVLRSGSRLRVSRVRTFTIWLREDCLAFHTWSQFDRTPVMDVIDLPAHRPLIDSSTLAKKLSSVLTPPVEFFTIDIGGGVVLDG